MGDQERTQGPGAGFVAAPTIVVITDVIAARGRHAWAEVTEQFLVLARAWDDTAHGSTTVDDIAAALSLIAPAVLIDQTFLGGRGTTGLQHLLAQRLPR